MKVTDAEPMKPLPVIVSTRGFEPTVAEDGDKFVIEG